MKQCCSIRYIIVKVCGLQRCTCLWCMGECVHALCTKNSSVIMLVAHQEAVGANNFYFIECRKDFGMPRKHSWYTIEIGHSD